MKTLTRKELNARRDTVRDLLEKYPLTVDEVARRIGMSNAAARGDIDYLRDELHVACYVKVGKAQAAQFRYGEGEDAPLPPGCKPMQRRSKTPVRKPIVAFRYWMDVALFGEYRRAA